jgi:hypothetical protein
MLMKQEVIAWAQKNIPTPESLAEHEGYEFCLNEKVEFTRLGRAGIKAYLSVLEQKFTQQLRQNKITKGYSLFLPDKQINGHNPLKESLIEGMNELMTTWLTNSKDNYFFCRELTINVTEPAGHDHEHAALITQLACLIELADQVKLAKLNLHFTTLKPEQITQLSTKLQSLTSTTVRFGGLPTPEIALELEAIAEAALQKIVDYTASPQGLLAKNRLQKPPLFAMAKINVLLHEELILPQIQGKIGIQNKYHYELAAHQQTEAKILQSWQIDQMQEIRRENIHKESLMTDERNSLISWHDIDAAMTFEHPNHLLAKNKLGEEILHYSFSEV